MFSTRHNTQNSQVNSRHHNSVSLEHRHFRQSFPQSSDYLPSTTYPTESSTFELFNSSPSTTNYVPPSVTRQPYTRRNSNGSTSGGGAIEKTNMMSSENPFPDPARLYDQANSARTITSITSPPKSNGSINKSLNLSSENPFHAVYGNYHYPSQIDPSKRITNSNATPRSTDNKSLNLSDENPFHSTYGRYHYPSQVDPQKRITETPKVPVPLIPKQELSDDNLFGNYRSSLIREYSAGDYTQRNGGGGGTISTSIADWTRNNPAPLSYRPIQVQRPPSVYSNQNDFIPLVSQQQYRSPPTRVQSQTQKSISSAPLEKTSLNMSPDNPFADTYGRYYYPSSEQIKAQKRVNEPAPRFSEQTPKPMTELPEVEKKETAIGKGGTKFTRFDVTF